MSVEVILFDWGGTLVSVGRQAEALRCGSAAAVRVLDIAGDAGVADRLAVAILRAEHEAAADPAHREADLEAVVIGWVHSLADHGPTDRLAELDAALGNAWVGSLDPLDGALDTVHQLRRAGYRLGLVSNCCIPPRYCRQELARQGFAEALDFAVFSSDMGYRKPSEVIYREALRQAYPAGLPADLSRVLFVGDAPVMDVIAPAAMGMKTALVSTAPGTWPAADHARAHPDFRIESVAELPDLLNHT